MKRESELYKPVRDLLVQSGYVVRGEVKGCDIAAVRGDDLVVVELKRALTLTLLMQATERRRITDSVYVAVPAPARLVGKRWRGMQRLIRQLELGLILVFSGGIASRAQVVFHPLPYERRTRTARRRAVIQEMAGRTGDHNVGGMTAGKIVTAYRESALRIACCLERLGPSSPKTLRARDTGPKTGAILGDNVYGWFVRVDRGIYDLTTEGRRALDIYADLAGHYRAAITSIPS